MTYTMKLLFSTLFILCFSSTVLAQNKLNLGVSANIPIGDANNFASFAVAGDLNYLFDVAEYWDVGPFTGISNAFGDRVEGVELEDVRFVPFGGAVRFEFLPRINFGLDIGYAWGIGTITDSGLYFSPRAQVTVSKRVDIVAAYRGISRSGSSWDMIGIGAEFLLN